LSVRLKTSFHSLYLDFSLRHSGVTMSSQSSKAQSCANKTVTSTSSSSASSSGGAAQFEGSTMVTSSSMETSSSVHHVQQGEGTRLCRQERLCRHNRIRLLLSTSFGALSIETPHFQITSAPYVQASDGPVGMMEELSPLEFRAATATTTSSVDKGTSRNTASWDPL